MTESSLSDGLSLIWNEASHTISSLSVPSMQFEKSAYTMKERDGVLHIPIIRTGDLSFKSSVRCFTRTMSAMVMDDFEERRNTDESRITFFKGEKVENSTHLLLFSHHLLPCTF